MPKWIKLSEQKPTKSGKYLVYSKDRLGHAHVLEYYADGSWVTESWWDNEYHLWLDRHTYDRDYVYGVTHWAKWPIPRQPKD